ncbi:bifunctional protein PutA [Kordiimonas sediminis]|uniref:Bifunctional protein PutA n=1 Tax=Kordiimonas sediminis TaxID=1735581 RepID=A0A919E7Z4_9PROT|nr:bifunctional proline dehydrogenase/L-glutamate gamma-semialdehyde dehydrogenase PutA [Kordiimonas sediminis]GHF23951.1 bifunctional protein PutA [Kordiimonas sediminis]
MTNSSPKLLKVREEIRSLTYANEDVLVPELIGRIKMNRSIREKAVQDAQAFVTTARSRQKERSLLDAFLQEFGLSNQEGIALMCLAEALMRVPDADTADALINEKLSSGNWSSHKGRSGSSFVNAATWALMITGKFVRLDPKITKDPSKWMNGMVSRLGEPVVRKAIQQAMKIMGSEFVLGRTIQEAIKLTRKNGKVCSFDMLGEGARTAVDADRYFESYSEAISNVAATRPTSPEEGHGISVKLSALHPRYEFQKSERVMTELYPRILELCKMAKASNMHLTIDAEEAARLDMSLDIIEALARAPELADWNGLGLALQCYGRRAYAVLKWVIELSQETDRKFMVRLVKGAYWDTEIKLAQEEGLPGYPVMTRKASTDVSYLACASLALKNRDVLYPQFATHNAHTVAAVLRIAGNTTGYEFQRLHGMGELMFSSAATHVEEFPQVRVYAPVGNHKDLLAYLVRRLLENGANSSFVNRFLDEKVAVEDLVVDPIEIVNDYATIAHDQIPLPLEIFGKDRRNSKGLDLTDIVDVEPLMDDLAKYQDKVWKAAPIIGGKDQVGMGQPATNPAMRLDVLGEVQEATQEQVLLATELAVEAYPDWDFIGGEARARYLEDAADALEDRYNEFMALLVREAGKTLSDAIAEVREAIDFLRYYAAQARAEFTDPIRMPGPTGEKNLYKLHGRGVFVCISPWNFPLAIFMGQVAAALAAGNAVLAKPAEQTPIVAYEAVKLLHKAGIPGDVLHLLPGTGETVGATLTSSEKIAGVAMTGSTDTAKIISRVLAYREGPIIPFIAETGGQNAMFVDSTALPEQVVDDVVRSAFHSAGQRCSALRILYIQDNIADTVIEMIKGAMDEMALGDPAKLTTDIGPVIDDEAKQGLLAHAHAMSDAGKLLHKVKPGPECSNGDFVGLYMFEISGANDLQKEQFGPILHVVRYKTRDLKRHLDELKATGYGLTIGVHSRIEGMADYIYANSLAGNTYVNRDQIGAVVGVQPFGGKGLSGTGPKAGGPLYMHRFAGERVLTINTVATGGNADLLMLG